MNEVFIIIASILFSALFSGMEIAFISSNKLILELDKQSKSSISLVLSKLTSNQGHYLATMLVGNNIALVIFGLAFSRLIKPTLVSHIESEALILLTQTIISTLIILLTAEFLPKVIFRINPNSLLRLFAIPMYLIYLLLWPIANIMMHFSNIIIKLFSKSKNQKITDNSAFSRIDLYHLINHNINLPTPNNNNDEDSEIQLFRNALDFSKVKVRDCLIPRTEIEAIEVNEPIPELKLMFIESGYSKILVYDGTIDNIIGYIHNSQLFKNPQSIREVINTILVVPESMLANNLLSIFAKKNRSIAVVIDEFGGTAGITTREDILEEIFGEIDDEHDTEEFSIKKVKENEWILSARLSIDAINEKISANLPLSEEYETLAGLLINQSQSIPKVNTIITLDNYEFRIVKATTSKIELVLLKIIE